ncbi:MAG: DUF58 domain-containing protein [Deltaproteobacteria bacterium]|nr:DUF58 domain-containing protein [Deltaproteobacteria bacterium]
MIFPRSRLIWVLALALIPFAGLGASSPQIVLVSAGCVAVLFAFALLDAVLVYGSLDGISVDIPDVVYLLKDREGCINLRIKKQSARSLKIQLGLPLPAAIQSREKEYSAFLPAGDETFSLSWICTAIKRGKYWIDQYYIEGSSPLSLWSVRTVTRADAEVRVYPNLMNERKTLAPFFLKQGKYGAHAQRQVGRGRDFEKLRYYTPGDSYDEIHWKATAKRRFPITKVFQIERTQEVYVVVDASRLSTRKLPIPIPDPGKNKQQIVQDAQLESHRLISDTTLERFVTAALALGMSAEQQGDHFGLLTFDHKVQKFLRAKSGKGHYSACREVLTTLQPQAISPDFDDICSFIRVRLRRRALLVFLTSLDDPVLAEGFIRNMRMLCRQHLVMVCMVKPPGMQMLFSEGDMTSVDDLYRNLGGHMQLQSLNEMGKVLQRFGAHFSLLENERLISQLISQYVALKQRQLL